MSGREREPSRAQQSRRAARELAVQGLYQWQMTGKSIAVVESEFRGQVADEDMEDHENWRKVMELADLAMFHELLTGVARTMRRSMASSNLSLIVVSRIWMPSSWPSCAWGPMSCRIVSKCRTERSSTKVSSWPRPLAPPRGTGMSMAFSTSSPPGCVPPRSKRVVAEGC